MGTIFVAYGEPGRRDAVLAAAAEQAAASGHRLLVYHVQEGADDDPDAVRADADAALSGTDIDYEVRVDAKEEFSDDTNVAPTKRLTDVVLDGDYEYVVMGDVEHDALEQLTHPSMTRAVLELHAVPVLLVPV
ncbi:MAG: universal stress protein [Halarchaeum sp.]